MIFISIKTNSSMKTFFSFKQAGLFVNCYVNHGDGLTK